MSSATATALEVRDRNPELNPRQLRATHYVPATVYGKGSESASIEVPTKDFYMSWRDGQMTFTLNSVNGKAVDVKVQHVQRDPVTDDILNIEFIRQG